MVETKRQDGACGGRDGAQAVHRAVALLREVAAQRGSASLNSLCAATGLAPGTAHRVLGALVSEGMLLKDPRTRRYRPGLLLHELGLAATPMADLRALARPILERLATATGDTAYLNVRSGSDAFCLDLCKGSSPPRALPMVPGSRRPLGVGAASLAVLGALPVGEARVVIACNAGRYRRSGLSGEGVAGALRDLRSRGYAVTTGRLGPRYRGVGVPVSDPRERFALALSVSAMAEQLDTSRIEQVALLLQGEARSLALALSKTAADQGTPKLNARAATT